MGDHAAQAGADRWFDRTGRRISDPWSALGLEPGAPAAEVVARYRERVRACPPERDPDGFARLTRAFRLLTRAEQRVVRDIGRVPHISVERFFSDEPSPTSSPGPKHRLEDELLFFALCHHLPFTASPPPPAEPVA